MSVTIRFCGAARTVTGSCYLFETRSGRFLVDCGLFQGQKTLKELNYGAFPFRPADIDAVLLTHAHIDHSGLLPKLVRNGFAGRILATRGTIDLCSYMLPDAGSIQESEVAALNRRNAARGRAEVSPIYTQADAIASLQSFTPVDYEKWVDVIPGVRARYWNAGHLLGSASIEIEFAGEDASKKPLRILASGDIGPDAKLLQPDPEAPAGFDYVISESTYGDRERPPITPDARRARLAAEVRDAAARKGALLIPAFAVERTQELIVDLVDLMERGEMPAAPIFLDSPLAIRATEVFRKHASSLDPEVDVRRLLNSPQLRFTETVEESKAIAKLTGFHIIIAASGMCDAGRIRHHLEELAVEREGHRVAGRLSGPGNARPLSGRRRQGRSHPGQRDQGRGAYPKHRRLFRTCRRHGTCAMDRRAPPDSSAACFWSMAKSPPSPASRNAFPSGSSRPRGSFSRCWTTSMSCRPRSPTPLDVSHRRRLAPEAVVSARLAQRHVEAHPRYQRAHRGCRRRSRPWRHYPEIAARAG